MTMTPETALGAVTDVLSQIAPEVVVGALDPAADLRMEADLDSLSFLSLVEGLAERTGVQIPESDYDEVRTLSGLTRYVAEHSA